MNAHVGSPLLDTINPLSRKSPIREHEGEPVRGLPEKLPHGETVLWQGAPDGRLLARRAFHVRGLALYFVALAVLRAVTLWPEGAGEVATGVGLTLLLGAIPIGILTVVASLAGRTTLYTLTDRRLVMRVGIALPMTLNIPHALVGSAATRVRPDGTGDVILGLLPPHRISYVALWPHARPWHFGRPEPMLRCIPDAARVAGLLSRALAAGAEQPVPALHPAPSPVGLRDIAAQAA